MLFMKYAVCECTVGVKADLDVLYVLYVSFTYPFIQMNVYWLISSSKFQVLQSIENTFNINQTLLFTIINSWEVKVTIALKNVTSSLFLKTNSYLNNIQAKFWWKKTMAVGSTWSGY